MQYLTLLAEIGWFYHRRFFFNII